MKLQIVAAIFTPEGQRCTMGWTLVKRSWAGGNALKDNGDNSQSDSVIRLDPNQDTCFVATCTCDGAGAEEACDDAIAELIHSF